MKSTADSWLSAINDPNLNFPVSHLLSQAGLKRHSTFPSADDLNETVVRWHKNAWEGPVFRGQGTFADAETRYYEEIIYQDNCVPTREGSWHDLFNALVWLQFPRTKKRLNTLHIEDINAFGVHPRTARRNRVTHFDECGVVIAVPEDKRTKAEFLLNALAFHQWETVFLQQRAEWGSCLFPMIVGHANFEMLLNPFEGLTGKWLAVVVPEGFEQLSYAARCEHVDCAMDKQFAQRDLFSEKGHMHPLPLLGVPDWFDNTQPGFYQNTAYFRPVNAGKVVKGLLP